MLRLDFVLAFVPACVLCTDGSTSWHGPPRRHDGTTRGEFGGVNGQGRTGHGQGGGVQVVVEGVVRVCACLLAAAVLCRA